MPPSATGAVTTKRTTSGGSDRPPLTPRRVEDEELRPYVIVSDLGKGSFATVYRGYHEVCHTSLQGTLDVLILLYRTQIKPLRLRQ